MADYPSFTLDDVANWSGRPAVSYPVSYTQTAIAQALLLFKIGTCLAALPDDDISIELAKQGILAMADMIVLEQEFQKAKASPFNSESIGSYHYSKTYARAAAAVQKQVGTGVMWFDLAIEKLSVCNVVEDTPMGGGITIFDTPTIFAHGNDNNVHWLSPSEVRAHAEWGYDTSAFAEWEFIQGG